MNVILLLVSCLLWSGPHTQSVTTYIQYAEVMPEYPGGEAKLMDFVYANLRYPDYSYEHHVEGRVVVALTVMADGRVDSVRTLKGVAPDLDKEAMHVVNMLERFKPGMRSGKPVAIRFVLPVSFKVDTAHPGSRRVLHL